MFFLWKKYCCSPNLDCEMLSGLISGLNDPRVILFQKKSFPFQKVKIERIFLNGDFTWRVVIDFKTNTK